MGDGCGMFHHAVRLLEAVFFLLRDRSRLARVLPCHSRPSERRRALAISTVTQFVSRYPITIRGCHPGTEGVHLGPRALQPDWSARVFGP